MNKLNRLAYYLTEEIEQVVSDEKHNFYESENFDFLQERLYNILFEYFVGVSNDNDDTNFTKFITEL